MIKGIKVQLKPNNKQNSLLFQCAGTARFIYNWTLDKQEKNYINSGKFISDGDLRKELTKLKKTEELKWLNKYSNNIPKQAVKDACDAYKKFFKKLVDKPKFKSKRKTPPKFYHDTDKIKFTQTHVQLEKLGKVKLSEFSRIPTSGKYINPRVSFDGLNWWVSVGIEIPDMVIDKLVSEPLGIDAGIKDLAVVSNGEIHKNINKTRSIKKADKKLKRLQRQASRQYEKNKKFKIKGKGENLLKLEKQINTTYKRLTNIRANHLHQTTFALVKNKPEYIVIEDLNVKGMMKNKHLSKAVASQCLREFRRQLEYKCEWYGIPLIIADRWYPSSKTCSCCGYVKKDLNLSDRVYRCSECSLVIDRDLNASINLREYPKLAKVM